MIETRKQRALREKIEKTNKNRSRPFVGEMAELWRLSRDSTEGFIIRFTGAGEKLPSRVMAGDKHWYWVKETDTSPLWDHIDKIHDSNGCCQVVVLVEESDETHWEVLREGRMSENEIDQSEKRTYANESRGQTNIHEVKGISVISREATRSEIYSMDWDEPTTAAIIKLHDQGLFGEVTSRKECDLVVPMSKVHTVKVDTETGEIISQKVRFAAAAHAGVDKPLLGS